MKIKFGTVTKDVKRFTSEINRTDWGSAKEQLSVSFDDTQLSATELDELIIQNFDGNLTLTDDGMEDRYEGFKYEGVRKDYDKMGRQITVTFRKSVQEQEA